MVKMILSLKQGYDGSKSRCIVCGREGETDPMDIHHFDGTESHNEIPNLAPADHPCNSSLNGKKREATRRDLLDQSRLGSVSASEIGAGPRASTNERTITDESPAWSSKEGAKHDIQRPVWNRWIIDLEKGPFRGNAKLYRKSLSDMAPWGLARYLGLEEALGSSVTYRRFITEDVAGGILGLEEDDFGKAVVFLNYQPKTAQS